MEGEGVVSERVAQRCFERFNTEEGNGNDLPRSGKPKLQGIENICRVLEEDPQKVLVGCQKNLPYQKILYVAKLSLRLLENHSLQNQ